MGFGRSRSSVSRWPILACGQKKYFQNTQSGEKLNLEAGIRYWILNIELLFFIGKIEINSCLCIEYLNSCTELILF
jgi:hypothetical protein